MKYFATFGIGQLDGFNINPMDVMVYIKGASETELRERLQKEPFNNRYCTTYPISFAKKQKTLFGMKLISMEELLSKRRIR